jgi:glyoxylase-like metal-dependent hydrolase (beta-lactamase superfamily II)
LVRHIPSGDLIIIDPGEDSNSILDKIENEGSKLKLVLLTHGHYDHVGAVKPICEKFDIPFFLHKDDARLLNRAPTYALAFENKSIEISKNYRFLGADNLEWAGEEINVMHLPGHTPGSVCYYFGGMAFTGDIILKDYIGRTDLPGANSIALQKSISSLLNSLPSNTSLFPGHGESWLVSEAAAWWESQQSFTQPNQIKGSINAK